MQKHPTDTARRRGVARPPAAVNVTVVHPRWPQAEDAFPCERIVVACTAVDLLRSEVVMSIATLGTLLEGWGALFDRLPENDAMQELKQTRDRLLFELGRSKTHLPPAVSLSEL